MISLIVDLFFEDLAVCMMFGLTFAALLAKVGTPVMHATFFDIHDPNHTPLTKHQARPLSVLGRVESELTPRERG
jgi:multidrug efflux pump subunit AcrB